MNFYFQYIQMCWHSDGLLHAVMDAVADAVMDDVMDAVMDAVMNAVMDGIMDREKKKYVQYSPAYGEAYFLHR